MNLDSQKIRSKSDKIFQQNVSDKVKEIKLKQQNWLKQREEDESNKTGSECSPGQAVGYGHGTRSAATCSQRQSVQSSSELGARHRAGSRESLNKAVQKNGEKSAQYRGRLPNEVAADNPDLMKGRSEIRSHCCPVCSELMVAPHHVPMLIVPCGHSLCARCSRSKENCPVCNCYIESCTCNLMLQQIVVNYQRQLLTDSSSKKTENSSASKEDIDNLMLRREVLEAEEESILTSIQQIEQQIRSEHKQIDSIDKEQERIYEQIQDLHLRLETLNQHRQQYIDKCQDLEVQRGEVETRLSLLQSTLAHVRRETDKFARISSRDDVM